MTVDLDPQKTRFLGAVEKLSAEEREELIKLTQPRVVEEYFKHIPHPAQQVFLTMNHVKEVMYGGAAGGGKALALDTPIVTPDGWTTMGALEPGDEVFDEMGHPTRVLAISGVMRGRPCYRVTFSDGASIVADAEHLWVTRKPSGKTQTITTQQMADTVVSPSGRRNHAVQTSAPLELPEQQYLIDPYVFGLWLGDGDTRRGYVTIGEQDAAETLRHLKDCGEEVTQLDPTHYRIEGLSERLRQIGVLGTYRKPNPKSVPLEYLRGSVAQRRALLQGIVDSDGHVDGDIEVCWTNRALTEALLELLHSLGIKARAYESRATLDGRDCGSRWRVKWMTDIQSARLSRKVAAQKVGDFRGTHDYRYVTAVDPVASVPVQCIKVASPTGLFLAGADMVPTHNSDALLMAALQYVDVPGYSALILRRTWPDLNAPGAILDRTRTWLVGTSAKQLEGGRIWEFPSGARIQFGYTQYEKDKYKFQSAEYQFVGFDELTHFEESTYTYLFSRIRRPAVSCLNCGKTIRAYRNRQKNNRQFWAHTTRQDRENCRNLFPDPKVRQQYGPSKQDGMTLFDVPLRMRSATNPGGVGHQWVKARFIDPKTRNPESVFVPARITDNPSLDQQSYIENLEHLLPIDRERLLRGDWDVEEEGEFFARHWFIPVDDVPARARRVRFWDLAGSDSKSADYSVGALVSLADDGTWYIEDIQRFKGRPHEVERRVLQTAASDGPHIPIRMEQEPGSSGLNTISHYRRNILVGYNFDGVRSTGSKEVRATPVSSAAESGNVKIVKGPWNATFLEEAALFPLGAHDDQVDGVSGAFAELAFGKRTRLIV